MIRRADAMPARCADANPIDVTEALAAVNDYSVRVALFGCTNYSRTGLRAQPLALDDVPSFDGRASRSASTPSAEASPATSAPGETTRPTRLLAGSSATHFARSTGSSSCQPPTFPRRSSDPFQGVRPGVHPAELRTHGDEGRHNAARGTGTSRSEIVALRDHAKRPESPGLAEENVQVLNQSGEVFIASAHVCPVNHRPKSVS